MWLKVTVVSNLPKWPDRPAPPDEPTAINFNKVITISRYLEGGGCLLDIDGKESLVHIREDYDQLVAYLQQWNS